MATSAHLLLATAAAADHSRGAEWLRDLEAIPGVQRVYRVLGRYDLLVAVEASAHVLRVADKIMAIGCVEHVVACFSPIGRPLRLGEIPVRL